MRISPFDFSQARTAPEHVVRGLEALDPSACLVHLGGARWMVGKVRPNAVVRAQAEGMLDHWTRGIQAGARMSQHGQQRVRFAQLALLGMRPVDLYTIVGEPDSRIVHAFQASRWRWLHATDRTLEEQIYQQDAKRKATAHAEISDVHRAADAWRYAFTRSHYFGDKRGQDLGPKSGFIRQPIAPAA